MAAKSKSEISLLTKIKQNEKIYEMLPKTVSRKTQNMNLKPMLMILANLTGDEAITKPEFRESIDYIRKIAPHHIESMLETGLELNTMMRQGSSAKKITTNNFKTIIEFHQFWIQGLWHGDDPLLQLPHFNKDVIKTFRKHLKEHKLAHGTIDALCRLTKEDRARMNLFSDKAKYADLENAIKVMPIVTVKAEAFTEEEKEMTMSDAITLKFTIKYDNLTEKEFPGYVCSRNFPYLKKSAWHLLVTDGATKEKLVIHHKMMVKDKNEVSFEMKQRFGQAG